LLRHAAGKNPRLPSRVLFHIVAARYATTPMAVRDWPVADYLDACSFLGVTGGHRGE
jgi:hypothetical protein